VVKCTAAIFFLTVDYLNVSRTKTKYLALERDQLLPEVNLGFLERDLLPPEGGMTVEV